MKWQPKRKCPWCFHDLNHPVPLNTLRTYASGSREAKRALRKGRAKVFRSTRHNLACRPDLVVCAHPCHDYLLTQIGYLPARP